MTWATATSAVMGRRTSARRTWTAWPARGFGSPTSTSPRRFAPRRERNPDQSKLTTQYTERAVAFIEKNKDKPFFLYVPHTMPHVPLAVSDKFKGKSQSGLYGDVVEELDWSAGEILAALKKHNLDDK